MVFLQINMTSANKTSYYIGLSGSYTCKIIGISYFYDKIPYKPGEQLLILISDKFTFTNSNLALPDSIPNENAFAFNNSSNNTILTSGYAASCTINISDSIDFRVIDYTTSSAPDKFKYCILTLELTPISI